jgi:hypothetical protein
MLRIVTNCVIYFLQIGQLFEFCLTLIEHYLHKQRWLHGLTIVSDIELMHIMHY